MEEVVSKEIVRASHTRGVKRSIDYRSVFRVRPDPSSPLPAAAAPPAAASEVAKEPRVKRARPESIAVKEEEKEEEMDDGVHQNGMAGDEAIDKLKSARSRAGPRMKPRASLPVSEGERGGEQEREKPAGVKRRRTVGDVPKGKENDGEKGDVEELPAVPVTEDEGEKRKDGEKEREAMLTVKEPGMQTILMKQLELDDREVELHKIHSGIACVAGYEMVGVSRHTKQRKDKVCEDRILERLLLDGSVYVCVVADGHGGSGAAQFFSTRLMESVVKMIESPDWKLSTHEEQQHMKTFLIALYHQLDDEYLIGKREEFKAWQKAGAELPAPDDDGSTLSLNIFDKRHSCYVNCNLGDSRAALFSLSQLKTFAKIVFFSLDHHPTHNVASVLEAGGAFLGNDGGPKVLSKNGLSKGYLRIQPRYLSNPYGIPFYSLFIGATMGDLLFKLKGEEKRELVLAKVKETLDLPEDYWKRPILSCTPDVEFRPLDLSCNYALLVGSDGFWDTLYKKGPQDQAKLALNLMWEQFYKPPASVASYLCARKADIFDQNLGRCDDCAIAIAYYEATLPLEESQSPQLQSQQEVAETPRPLTSDEPREKRKKSVPGPESADATVPPSSLANVEEKPRSDAQSSSSATHPQRFAPPTLSPTAGGKRPMRLTQVVKAQAISEEGPSAVPAPQEKGLSESAAKGRPADGAVSRRPVSSSSSSTSSARRPPAVPAAIPSPPIKQPARRGVQKKKEASHGKERVSRGSSEPPAAATDDRSTMKRVVSRTHSDNAFHQEPQRNDTIRSRRSSSSSKGSLASNDKESSEASPTRDHGAEENPGSKEIKHARLPSTDALDGAHSGDSSLTISTPQNGSPVRGAGAHDTPTSTRPKRTYKPTFDTENYVTITGKIADNKLPAAKLLSPPASMKETQRVELPPPPRIIVPMQVRPSVFKGDLIPSWLPQRTAPQPVGVPHFGGPPRNGPNPQQPQRNGRDAVADYTARPPAAMLAPPATPPPPPVAMAIDDGAANLLLALSGRGGM